MQSSSATAESPAPTAELGIRASVYRRAMMTNPLFKSLLLVRMPLLAMAGARIEQLDLDACQVRLPFGWRSQNIFGSMYFGATLMSAEAACGGLVLLHEQNSAEKFGPIVKRIEADFVRAAFDDVVFTCDQGARVAAFYDRARRERTRVEEVLEVVGRNATSGPNGDAGEEVARVRVTWSARVRG